MYDDITEASLEKISSAENWQVKYRLLIRWGGMIKAKPALRDDMHLIQGCETPAWLGCELDESHQFHFSFDSDSRVIKGLAAVLLSVVNGRNREYLAQCDVQTLLRQAGLEKHLTPSRSNGFQAIVERVYSLAQLDLNKP